jgi:hypothetical protein
MAKWNRLFGNIINADKAADDPGPHTGPASPKTVPDEWTFAELGQFKIHEASVRLPDYEFCLQNYVVVLDEVKANPDAVITIGMLHPDDTGLVKRYRTSWAALCSRWH